MFKLNNCKSYLEIWNERLEKDANSIFIINRSKTISYEKMWRKINAISAQLQSLGVKKGDYVALNIDNNLKMVELILSLMLIGAVAAPLNRYFSAEEIRAVLSDNPYALFISDEINNVKLILSKSIEIKEIYENLNLRKKNSPIENIPEAVATLILSSGSSASPKAILHSFSNHYYSAIGSNKNIYFGRGDIWLLSLPLYHVAGLSILFRALISGATVRLPHRSELVRHVLREESVTHLSIVETQLSDLLADESLNEKISKLKAILTGGSAVSPKLIEDSYSKGWNLYSTYGSTEMTSQITTTSTQASLKELKTNGKLLKYRNLMMSRENEVLVKGETLCLGYLKKGELINIRDENGWFASGDLGMVDENGFLHIQGRKDNMFISGGENIYPEFIERKIKELPEVLNALVIPVKNEKFGFRPAVFLQIKTGEPMDMRRLKRLLQDKLVKYMIPDYIFPWPQKIEKMTIKISRKYFEALAQKMI